MFRILLLVALLFLSSTNASSCDEGWELFDGKCYFFRSGELLTWSLAQQFCQEKGGNLPLPQDRVENTGLWNLYTKNINKGNGP